MATVHSASVAAVVLLTLSSAIGCGVESSVVGGRCAAGMELSGGACVAKRPGATQITPTEPPAGSFGAGTPASGQVGGITPPTFDSPFGTPPLHSLPLDPLPFQLPPVLVAPIVVAPIVVAPIPPRPPLVCTAPLVVCRGACIPVVSDPLNCGACNKICASNICIDGECQGTMPGDVVLIGHDYTTAIEASAQAKVLVNALTIPTTEPIRVLSYEDGATDEAVTRAKVVAIAGLMGRTIDFTRADGSPDLASATLSRSFDVVLIHGVSGSDPDAVGASWSSSLGGFARKGGVVVAIDNGSSPMPALLSSAGLLLVGSHATLPDGAHLFVTAAQDVVGVQIPSPYAGFGASVGFQGIPAPNDDLTWVVRVKNAAAELADPVVVHRIVR